MYDFSRLKKRARSTAVGLAASGMVLSNVASVSALANSSLTLSDPRPGETNVSYTFDTSTFSGNSIQCTQLEFNTQADMAGAVPTGFDSTSATFNASSTMLTQADWNPGLDVTANGTIELQYATGEVPSNGDLIFDAIDNPTSEGTYFVEFRTYTDACTTLDDSVVIAFVNNDGELVQLTIDPTLTFTVSGVIASEAAAGTTTTHPSTGSGINYLNDVTNSTNGVAAHDLNVTTNAPGGYTVYIRSTDQLRNANGDTIDNHAGTNPSPTAFPAAGTAEAWGYNSSDATLSVVGDGASRFTDTNEFAGFTLTNQEVMFNTAATPSTQTERVTNQVAVEAATEAGTYQSTIVYTAVATF